MSVQQATTTPIPSLDLKAQYESIRDEITAAIHRVLESQQFILGSEVEAFERELAAFNGCSHAIGVASGSDALLVSLMSLRIGPGDEVVTTPYTFFATAGAIARLGAKPVFVDVHPGTFNIDPQQVEDYIRGRHSLLNDRDRFDHDPRRVKAIIPVHLFGQCAEMDPILEIASGVGVPVVEDAAQAIGASEGGRIAGTMGRLGCLSFFPSKNLGAAGDAGAILTNDAGLAETIKMLRGHGSKPKYFHQLIGLNSRLDAIQAAVLRVKLPRLNDWTERRMATARVYDELLEPLANAAGDSLQLPVRRSSVRHIFNQYVIRSSKRDEVQRALKLASIGSEIYYPLPMHLQQCFSSYGYREGDLPHSELAARQSLALPLFPEIQLSQQQRVAETIATAIGN